MRNEKEEQRQLEANKKRCYRMKWVNDGGSLGSLLLNRSYIDRLIQRMRNADNDRRKTNGRQKAEGSGRQEKRRINDNDGQGRDQGSGERWGGLDKKDKSARNSGRLNKLGIWRGIKQWQIAIKSVKISRTPEHQEIKACRRKKKQCAMKLRGGIWSDRGQRDDILTKDDRPETRNNTHIWSITSHRRLALFVWRLLSCASLL